VNRRIGGIIGAIVLALIGAVLVIAYANGADQRAEDGTKVVAVYTVKSGQIPAGTPTSDLGDRVAKTDLPKKAVADGAITDLDQVKGLVTGALLVKGEQLVRQRFTTPSAFQASGSSVAVPPGYLSTTISLAPERAVGGVLSPGSTVAISASFAAEGGTPAQSGVLLQKVLVTNVQVADPSTAETTDTTEPDSSRPGTSPQGSLLVTVALPAGEVSRLVYATEHGTIWLSTNPLVAPEAPGTPVARNGIYR
jgi:pilus assembly protein CpaB